jgi:chromosome segregation ATPase
MDATALREELARADAEFAASLAAVDALTEATARLGARATELAAFLTGLPDEQAHRERELVHAHDDLARAQEELEQAETALTEAQRHRDETRTAVARRHHEHAVAALAVAEQHERRLRERLVDLDAERDSALLERDLLLAEAERLAAELAQTPRLSARGGFPVGSVDTLPDWASSVRAALLVARSGLAAERDALLRQAAELAATAPLS